MAENIILIFTKNIGDEANLYALSYQQYRRNKKSLINNSKYFEGLQITLSSF